jgi:hypothetical protein
MSHASSGKYMGIFTLVLDTTTAAGIMTVDLTDYFYSVDAVYVGGELVATENGYMIKAYKPASATALTATNLSLGFYQSAGSAAEMASVDSTDLSTAITGLTIVVIGNQAV